MSYFTLKSDGCDTIESIMRLTVTTAAGTVAPTDLKRSVSASTQCLHARQLSLIWFARYSQPMPGVHSCELIWTLKSHATLLQK